MSLARMSSACCHFLIAAAGVAAAALLARLRRPALAARPAGMQEVADGLGRAG